MIGRKTYGQVDWRLRQAYPTTPRKYLEDAPVFSLEFSVSFLPSWTFPFTPLTLAQSSLTRGELPTTPSNRLWSWIRSYVKLARTQSK